MGVAVAVAGEGGAVEDEGHVAVFALVVYALEFGEHDALQKSGADYEDGTVHMRVDDLCVGHHLDGRTVYEDVVVMRSELIYQLAETR